MPKLRVSQNLMAEYHHFHELTYSMGWGIQKRQTRVAWPCSRVSRKLRRGEGDLPSRGLNNLKPCLLSNLALGLWGHRIRIVPMWLVHVLCHDTCLQATGTGSITFQAPRENCPAKKVGTISLQSPPGSKHSQLSGKKEVRNLLRWAHRQRVWRSWFIWGKN